MIIKFPFFYNDKLFIELGLIRLTLKPIYFVGSQIFLVSYSRFGGFFFSMLKKIIIEVTL
jgi:hypothetical protein